MGSHLLVVPVMQIRRVGQSQLQALVHRQSLLRNSLLRAGRLVDRAVLLDLMVPVDR